MAEEKKGQPPVPVKPEGYGAGGYAHGEGHNYGEPAKEGYSVGTHGYGGAHEGHSYGAPKYRGAGYGGPQRGPSKPGYGDPQGGSPRQGMPPMMPPVQQVMYVQAYVPVPMPQMMGMPPFTVPQMMGMPPMPTMGPGYGGPPKPGYSAPQCGPGIPPNPERDKKRALVLLAELKEPIKKHKAGFLLGIPRPVFMGICDELEKENLIKVEEITEDDKKKATLSITEEGKTKVEEFRKAMLERKSKGEGYGAGGYSGGGYSH